ncbi:MAG: 50S ribosomal protein L17 [Cyclobacteriaceae bacterium]
MRHGNKIHYLGRTASHRKAMLSNMASSLILNKRITTTVAKAKALRGYVEPLITKSKNDTTHSRRTVFSYLQDKESVNILFRDVAEKVAARPGGYTRIIKLGNRKGDNAEICMIELVDYNEIYTPNKKKKTAAKPKSRRSKGASKAKTETTETAPKGDDLRKVEGIGPKVQDIFNAEGIVSFTDLASKSEEELKAILETAGSPYSSMDSSTWAKQADMAAKGEWDALKKWQDELDGGKE